MTIERRTRPTILRRRNPFGRGGRKTEAFNVRNLTTSTELRSIWGKTSGGSSTGSAQKFRRRFHRVEAAEEALGQLERDMVVLLVTRGQYSMTELIIAILQQSGPAHATFSTWTVGSSEIETLTALVRDGILLSARFLTDFTFQRRQPQYAAQLRTGFGDESIRVTNNHAKWITLRTEGERPWNLAISTSANLNQNPRLELVWIHDSLDVLGFLEAIVDEIFEKTSPGLAYHGPAHHRREFNAATAGEEEGDGEGNP